MTKEIMTLSEAIVQGALDSNILTATHYPGAGASQVFNIFKKKINCSESVNEKIAYDICLGISYCGKRSVCVVKNVGLNVLSDSLINSCFSGINGGLVLITVDDMYVSYATNFQDSRAYYELTKTLILEPSSPQEAYDMIKEAFIISEKIELPIIIRLEKDSLSLDGEVNIKLSDKTYKPLPMLKNIKKWVLHPPFTVNQTRNFIKKQSEIEDYVEKSKFNIFIKGDKNLIISSSLAYNDLEDKKESIYKIGTFPIPIKKIRKLLEEYTNILVQEIGNPLIEKEVMLAGNKINVNGQINKKIKPCFEKGIENIKIICSDDLLKKFYFALNKNKPDITFGDIGIYTLGAFEPCNTLDTAICMGASIGMGIGAKLAGINKVFSVIGDSTFIHAGIPALIEAKSKNISIKLFVIDNHCAVSTGKQKTLGDINSIISNILPTTKNIDINKITESELANDIDKISSEKELSVAIINFPNKK